MGYHREVSESIITADNISQYIIVDNERPCQREAEEEETINLIPPLNLI